MAHFNQMNCLNDDEAARKTGLNTTIERLIIAHVTLLIAAQTSNALSGMPSTKKVPRTLRLHALLHYT